MRKKKLAIVAMLLFLAIGLVTAGIVWRDRSQRFEREKQAFVDRCQKAMEVEISKYFFMFEELPDSPLELVYPGSHIRTPWVFNGVVEFGFNRPTAAEGWEVFERDVFERTIPLCRDKVPEWQDRLTAARKPLVELDGDLEAQLALFVDPNFNRLAGHRFLMKLGEDRGVEEEAIVAFIEAYMQVLNVKLFKVMAANLADSEALAVYVDAKSDIELGLAMEKFQQAKIAILEQVK